MIPKILHWLGLAACITLIISCFLPWAYYPDIHQTFTGFYSYQNYYGRPGKPLCFLAAIILVFILLPKVWAKRANLFLCALFTGYAIYIYTKFTAQLPSGVYPVKKIGIYLMIISVITMLIAAVFPDLKLEKDKNNDNATA